MKTISAVKRFGMSSIYIRLVYIFIILVLICNITVGIFVYYNASRLMIDEAAHTHYTLLAQASVEIDRCHSSLYDIAKQMSANQGVNSALYFSGALTPTRMLVYKDTINYFREVAASYSYLRNIWVYNGISDTVLSVHGKHTPAFYLDTVFSYEDPWPYMNLREGLFPFAPLGRNRVSSADVISYAVSLPMNDARRYGTLVLDIDAGLYRDYLSVIGDHGGEIPACLLLMSPSGGLLTDMIDGYAAESVDGFRQYLLANEPEDGLRKAVFNGTEYTLASVTSRYGYRLFSVIPNVSFAEKAASVRDIVLFGSIVSILLGITITYFASTRLYKPIRRVVEYISVTSPRGEKHTVRDEMLLIGSFIETIYDQNKEIRSNLDQTRPIIVSKILLDTMELTVKPTPYQIQVIREYAGLVYDNYQVLLCVPESQNNFSRIKIDSEYLDKIIMRLRGIAPQSPEGGVICYYIIIKNGIICCIFNRKEDYDRPEFVHEHAHGIQRVIEQDFGLFCAIGIGESCKGINGLSSSYMEALFALKNTMARGGGILHIREASGMPQHLFEYTLDEERRIMNLLRSRSYQEVENELTRIVECNTQKDTAAEMMDNLFIALAGTGIRTLYEGQLSVEIAIGRDFNIYSELNSLSHKEDKLRALLGFYEKIILAFHTEAAGQDSEICKVVTDYVMKNYDRDISLQTISDAIGLSTSYISYIFKQASGVNFVEHVKTFRISKAKELMDSTELPINVICQTVGFRTTTNFNRVFRKYEGITPSEYRKIRVV